MANCKHCGTSTAGDFCGRDCETAFRLDRHAGYFTVSIPYVPREFRTPFHPTADVGPFSTLTRGAFASLADAISWGRENLNGAPYSIVFISDR